MKIIYPQPNSKITVPLFFAAGLLLSSSCGREKRDTERPNILWIIAEDMSPDFSCYGSSEIKTPAIDSLAASSLMFSNAFVTCPVCSPSRSALVTGMYQTSIGAHNHRSSRGEVKLFLPDSVKLVPEIFREAGYFTANCGYDYHPKTDYNFIWNPAVYDAEVSLQKDNSNWGELWKMRRKKQPFFIQLHLAGGKDRKAEVENPVDPGRVELPPYYPDTEIFRKNRAEYLNSVLNTDRLTGRIIQYLKENDLYDNTAIFFITDHGVDNYRDKQFLYESGIHIPMLIKFPGNHRLNGTENDDLVLHIDMVPTSLELAGIEPPEYLEGQSLLKGKAKKRNFLVSARDRCDWTIDRIRSVRSHDYKYIRNFFPGRSHMQSNYRDNWPTVQQALEMYKKGELNEDQARFFKPSRPAEELYYLPEDPHELHNLAGDTRYVEKLGEMRAYLDQWIHESNDQGEIPETEFAYNEALKNVNTGSTMQNFPLLLGATTLEKKEDYFESGLYFRNTSDKTIRITGNFGFYDSKKETIILDPGKEYTYPVRTTEPIEKDEPEKLNFTAEYEFSENNSREFSYSLTFVTPQIVEIPFSDAEYDIDGKLNEWGDLPLKVQHEDIQAGRFDVSYGDSMLYIAVNVKDEEVNSFENVEPWMQDGVEIRLDARSDPKRSAGIGTREFEDHLPVIMSPGQGPEPSSVYIPSLALRVNPELFNDAKGILYACRKTADGFNAEVGVPLTFIEEKQGKQWEKLRLNIIIHDKDGDISNRCSWEPEWGKETDYVGSGTFKREIIQEEEPAPDSSVPR